MHATVARPIRIAYFVHDLNDPAVRRRLQMFSAAGAEITLLGFRRGPPIAPYDGVQTHDLGQTADARFVKRVVATVWAALNGRRLAHRVAGVDLIVARNLEMLAVAQATRAGRANIPVIYESLDIHRLMLVHGLAGRGLRWLEGRLARRSAGLITSSPAFVENYFARHSHVRLPVHLVENKIFLGDAATPPMNRTSRGDGAPWRIGWFGALRCLKSFRILSAASRRLEGRLEVILRGRPAYTEFPDFDAMVTAEPYMRFEGPYRNPEDLLSIYGEVDFAWVIDFFEEGQNSEWLLPNRLYESGWAGTVPIALARTAIGHWLAERELGLRIGDDLETALIERLSTMSPAQFEALQKSVIAVVPSQWVCTTQDCIALLDDLVGADTAKTPLSKPPAQA